MSYFVYLVECRDGSLYCGIAKDLEKRIERHNSGKGSKYTRARLPVKVVWSTIVNSRTEALVEECRIKRLSRKKKLELINA